MKIDWKDAIYLSYALAAIENVGGETTLPLKTDISRWISKTCPECSSEADLMGYDHICDKEGNVLIGCEGYWVINPRVLGLDNPDWDDWMEYVDPTENEESDTILILSIN